MATKKTAPKPDEKPTGFDPTKLKILKKVTLPLLKFADGKTLYFKSSSEIFLGKDIKQTAGKGKDGKAKQMEPAHLMNIVDLVTGEDMQIITGVVLKETLEETYPNNGYVGKCFAATQSKIEGKRYKNYTILEVEEPSS